METGNPQPKAYPIPIVGALIYNDAGEVLLCRGPKFGDSWVIPGGKMELGEDPVEALGREIREELHVEIGDIEFINFQDALNPKNYYKPVHFIYIEYIAKITGGELATSDEIAEFGWFSPAKALSDVKLGSGMVVLLNKFIEHTKNKQEQQACAEYKQGWQRAVADYKNLQKEVESRKSEWAKMSEQYILEEFLPVYSNFKKAFAHHPDLSASESAKQIQNWINGIGHIQKQFGDVLKAHNVVEIKTVGEIFDLKLHETAGEEDVEGKKPGEIIREVDGGYTMNGKVIKVAKVIIAK